MRIMEGKMQAGFLILTPEELLDNIERSSKNLHSLL